jgi:phosphatidylglycerol:prolipoprotein diacylglycerol transferase
LKPIFFQFELFGTTFSVHAFGTFIVLAFLVGAFYVRRRAHRDLGLDKERVFNLCFALLFLGIVGARLLYTFVHHDEFSQEPLSFLYIWRGGLVFYGGLLACLFWLSWFLPRHPDLKGWALVDVLALGASLSIFVGRWASFLSGENYGKPTDLPWGVVFPPESHARPTGVALHPTQLYHSLHGLLLFVILWFVLRRHPHAGRVSGLFLMLYAIGRSVIEIWRADDVARGMVVEGLISTSQLISIPVFFAGLAIFLIRRAPLDETSSSAA